MSLGAAPRRAVMRPVAAAKIYQPRSAASAEPGTFVRFVGQYDNRTRDALRDPRSDFPLGILGDGVVQTSTKQAQRDIRVDWLVSYVPTPGTVVFAGYGASLYEPDAFRFREIERVRDGIFIKLSYLLRR